MNRKAADGLDPQLLKSISPTQVAIERGNKGNGRDFKRVGSATELLEHFHGTQSQMDSQSANIRYPSHHNINSSPSKSSSSPYSKKGQSASQYPRQQSNGSTNFVQSSQLSEADMYNVAMIMKSTGSDRPQAIQIYLSQRML
jgi:hypothetical protein